MARVTEPREERALERGLLVGIAAFRWPAWIWMTVVLILDGRNPDTIGHLWAAIAFDLAALAFTVWATLAVRGDPARMLAAPALAAEGAIAIGMAFADQWVYDAQFVHAQSLGSIWPLAWVMTVGLRYAGRGGALAGVAVGGASLLSQVVFVAGPWNGDRSVSAWGTVVLYTLGGAVAGFVAIKLREAERVIAGARAREEVARTLHDGVLQTLAIVQRRSDDDDLVGLAREQEHELREFLFGAPPGAARGGRSQPDLPAALRAAVARVERQHPLRAQVVLAGEPPIVSEAITKALAGAVAEALTNATKHGDAGHATVFLDTTEAGSVFCSVKDDGSGFDTAAATEGVGIGRSIRGRITEVGGRVEIDGRPGRGTEVRFWIP
jgi:signal transduction histidine kinase